MELARKYTLIIISLLLVQCGKTPEGGNPGDSEPKLPGTITVTPQAYDRALKNPLMGFTTVNMQAHPWATLTHTYIRWNDLENNESDGVDKIIDYCNKRWENAGEKNLKVIPRVYLHWDGDDPSQKHWPADIETDDYNSKQFQMRVVRLIERLGQCWDNDHRVAFIEMGLFGKWGEQHSPSAVPHLQSLVSDAFNRSFKNKIVTVRHFWDEFTGAPFGEYWDSWAHYDQMWTQGNEINKINESKGRYKTHMIGGEVAYNWGNWEIQPGGNPTISVSNAEHRNFVINTLRWLHCTQLRWIGSYDQSDPVAVAGAEEIQKGFGYRFKLNEVRFSMNEKLHVSFDVTNTGSAPFYYRWPIEVSLLNSETLKPVWQKTITSVDIREWLPGEKWTAPKWEATSGYQKFFAKWDSSPKPDWGIQPIKNRVDSEFSIDLANGRYILSLAIIDPASNKPSVKFATANYLKGAKHPIGIVMIGENRCEPLPSNFKFDDPISDNTLTY